MGGEQAANVLLTVKQDQLAARRSKPAMSAAQEEKFKRPILEKYATESSAYYSSARLWDDGVIDPVDTRMTLALGISASTNAPWPDRRQGVYRM
jgi:3-methylcrotonyl-CoA carboxylase beta subunit